MARTAACCTAAIRSASSSSAAASHRSAELLWTGDWRPDAHLPAAELPDEVLDVLRRLPSQTLPMDALRTRRLGVGCHRAADLRRRPSSRRGR